MHVPSGRRLGPYEIVAPLSAGGMGEVYRARDTRLDRAVAVKVLPAGFASDATLRLRFEREAKTISQLNHPHICTLHDVGRDGETDYIVMELVEGESLADRLVRGPLTVAETIRFGAQIAEALDRAHRAGIVHRDLKPGNVMLTKSGVKLLDFGLAKPNPVGGEQGLSVFATEQKPLTEEGTIVGTFQYMAPEQIEGKDADARSDIFALGAVLYEMATGKRAFEGKTKASLIAAIIAAEPAPISRVQPLTPPALEHIVVRCLAKDPDARWQSALDVASELRWIAESGAQPAVASSLARRRTSRDRLAMVLVALVAAGATWGAAYLTRPKREIAPVLRVDLAPTPPLVTGTGARTFDVSPDGLRLAYVAGVGEGDSIYVRRLDRSESTALPGTRSGRQPFFSPDGERIGFRMADQWKTVGADGGPVQPLVECECWTPSWGADGYVYFGSGAGIVRVPEGGGALETVFATPKATEVSDPVVLPGGRALLLTLDAIASERVTRVAAVEIGSGRARDLISGSAARYLEPGHLLYVDGNALTAVRFDPESLRISGRPHVIEPSIARNPVTRDAFFSASNNGVLAYVVGDTSWTDARLVWIDRRGAAEPVQLPPRSYGHPRISPDGRSIVVAIRELITDVWVHDIERKTFTRLTFVPVENEMPLWMPDGKNVLFGATREGDPRSHFVRAADGTGTERRLMSSRLHQHVTSVAPDGGRMLITEFTEKGTDVLLATMDGKDQRRLLASPFDEMSAQFSPDGKWIAYSSNESGRPEVFVIAADGGGKWQVSTDGGHNPVWSRDGRELFFIFEGRMFAVGVTSSPAFTPTLPHFLFEAEFELLPRGDTNYDVSPDGKRFLVVQRDPAAAQRALTMVANWPAQLERARR